MARSRILPYLRADYRLLKRLIVACREVAQSLSEVEHPGPAAHVQAILFARMAAELRSVELVLMRGHLLPAMTLGSAVFEFGLTSAWIGSSEKLAQRWLGWTDSKRAPWNAIKKEIIPAALANADVPLPTYPAWLEFAYEVLCWGKHANPRFRHDAFQAATAERHVINAEPIVMPKLLPTLRITLMLVTWSPLIALMAVFRSSFTDDGAPLGEHLWTVHHDLKDWLNTFEWFKSSTKGAG